jgi:hypothetical protein
MVFQTSVTFDHVTSDLSNSIDYSKVQDGVKKNPLIDSRNGFWNKVFDKEFCRYKECLDCIFGCVPLELVNMSTSFTHVFKKL